MINAPFLTCLTITHLLLLTNVATEKKAREVVLQVAVQLHHAYVHQRVIAVGPDLGEAGRVALSYLT